MSLFAKLRQRVDGQCSRTTFDNLTPGIQYPIYAFKQAESEFPDKKTGVKPVNLHLYFLEDGIKKKYVIMPNVYNDLDPEMVKELNDSIGPNKAPTMVLYGKDGNRNEVMIHEFGEGVDQERLSKYLKSELPSPAKRPRTSTSTSSSSEH